MTCRCRGTRSHRPKWRRADLRAPAVQSALTISSSGVSRRRSDFLDLPRGLEAVRQVVRERLRLIAEVRLEIGRRDLDSEGALAHLAFAEVAEQGQQRPNLAALVREADSLDVFAALGGAELLDLFQVDAPVPAADHVRGEWLPGQHRARIVRLQVRAQWHRGGEEPGRRAEADQVVVAL